MRLGAFYLFLSQPCWGAHTSVHDFEFLEDSVLVVSSVTGSGWFDCIAACWVGSARWIMGRKYNDLVSMEMSRFVFNDWWWAFPFRGFYSKWEYIDFRAGSYWTQLLPENSEIHCSASISLSRFRHWVDEYADKSPLLCLCLSEIVYWNFEWQHMEHNQLLNCQFWLVDISWKLKRKFSHFWRLDVIFVSISILL